MIRRRKHKTKPDTYQVVIRDKDRHPPVTETFPTRAEAKDWQIKERACRRAEIYFPEKVNKKRTLVQGVRRARGQTPCNRKKSKVNKSRLTPCTSDPLHLLRINY